MSLRNIGIVYRKELTEALRDSRTLISSILIPLFLFPVLTVGIGYAFVEVADQASHEASRIMVLGGADSPDVVQRLETSDKPARGAVQAELCGVNLQQENSSRDRFATRISGGCGTRLASRSEDLRFLRRFEVDAQRDAYQRAIDRISRQHGARSPSGAAFARKPDEAVQRAAAKRRVGRSRRRRIVRWADHVSRDFDVHDRRDVSGDGFDGRRKRARNDGDDSVESDRADASGIGKVFPGADGVARDGDAVGALDGRIVRGAFALWQRARDRRRFSDPDDARANRVRDFHHGAAGGGAFLGGADDDFAFCKNVQRSAELSDANDVSCDRSGNRGGDSRESS